MVDWVTPAISFCAAVIGVYTAHMFTSRRDLAAKRRELETKHLIDIWNDVEVANRAKTIEEAEKLERAIANIQLFGTEEMMSLAEEIGNSLKTTQAAETTNLQKVLRDTLRSRLGLPSTKRDYFMLTINPRRNK